MYISGAELGHPVEIWAHPGQRKVSGRPLGSGQKRKYIQECCEVPGVFILHLVFNIT